ncbi:MAG: TIGR03088 family PEP-CTERM/XrtA system glycosyltransferase [Aquabacterium sp.]|nr:TIGR03088 family PEP-CTERM/XrtA system glycosyltransferase [Aquabacterium sp.]
MTDPNTPLVLHLVYRFDTGGLENGVVNLINHMSADRYRHAVVALTDVNPAFAQRITRSDTQTFSLRKPPGHGARLWPAMTALIRRLQPAVVHTRNLAALEMQVPAAWCRVPARVHGEHGRDMEDLDGTRRRLQWVRRVYSPLVHHYMALSRDLAGYLEHKVGIAAPRVTQVYNGVDSRRFAPSPSGRVPLSGSPFADPSLWVVGTVGRMAAVKDQTHLARAFVRALELAPALKPRLRLAMIGDGPLRAQSQALLKAAGLSELAWLPGERSDVPDVMRSLNCFALPSLAEGISNTILEAMASGLPVIATDVGGNADLVVNGNTGQIVPPADVEALAAALVCMASDPAGALAMGFAGRAVADRRFSMQAMVDTYQAVYDRLLGRPTTAQR